MIKVLTIFWNLKRDVCNAYNNDIVYCGARHNRLDKENPFSNFKKIFCRTRLGVDAKRPGGERQFSGIMDVYVKTIKADGLMGLYRGFGISCTCIFIYRY